MSGVLQIISGRSIVVMHRPSKPARWVRSPSPAFVADMLPKSSAAIRFRTKCFSLLTEGLSLEYTLCYCPIIVGIIYLPLFYGAGVLL